MSFVISCTESSDKRRQEALVDGPRDEEDSTIPREPQSITIALMDYLGAEHATRQLSGHNMRRAAK